ncbi:ABC transporter ATP-binding protein [Agrobacterium pusense]|uniref:ABC transporter ATP-binding protein n=1 Tax=Agrobacterium pusense TaxID=648995 RepID=U4Q1Q6_9HYPH|nr:sn-glycerol-3-phosphate ABC transporter ATP-binding protein UgpC [Agrobacterium pusense]MBW9060727.1 sn-glycerol-3-phosphate ABC transporter ATP-binding protein UgpC [Agrobacterium pusense]OOO19212.1 glycerol-3-phosphate ABC transporter ATP-binding protein [Agrobacterium pusense]WKD44487.1 sn-glycerol-3-phosphate ABC transporter ATP-binding protein UgpC [Agrobacterium pusense]CDI09958.1 ABC transporter ATP-binding protein [Agrobacterium pusense]SDF43109.1 carbohydrate ABC transporter ATP-bi
MASIELKNVGKTYGDLAVLHGVDLDIRDGEFIVLVGPSGCGKSTLLRMIAGLEEITSGDLSIDGERVNDRRPKDRDIAMVFQSYALYPHMSVADNMSYSLRLRRSPKETIAAAVAGASAKLGLDPYLARRPKALSGGQRQRVAMGRAIMRQPKAFLFDEPLSNLDARLREQMRAEIKRMHADLGATSVYVTHDQIEAMTLASRIVAMNAGHVQQIGAPLDLYDRPANLFVAGFIGSPGMNFLEGRLGQENGGSFVVLDDGTRLALGREVDLADGEPVTLGIRPEHVTVAPAEGGVEATVDLVEPTGLGVILHLTVHGLPFKLFSSDRALLQPGRSLQVGFPQERLHVFDRNGVRIGEA